MPPRRLEVVVAPRAEDDQIGILLYSINTWGERQAARHEAALNRAFERLRRYPETGAARDDLPAGVPACRSDST